MKLRLFAGLLLVMGVTTFAGAQLSSTLSAGGGTVNPNSPAVDVPVLLDNGDGDIQGWSYGMCSDPALMQLDGLTTGTTTATVQNGTPPGFDERAQFPDGFTQGVVICFTGCAVLPPGTGYELLVGNYTGLGQDGSTTMVCPCDTLGSPTVATVIVVGGASLQVNQVCGTLDFVVPPTADFIRGDANSDLIVNIADGVWILNDLFQGGPHTNCDEANDSNDDGSFDASDAVYVFTHQFLNGPPPPAPWPNCGQVPGQAPEDCVTHACP